MTDSQPTAELQADLQDAIPDILQSQKEDGCFGTEPWISIDLNGGYSHHSNTQVAMPRATARSPLLHLDRKPGNYLQFSRTIEHTLPIDGERKMRSHPECGILARSFLQLHCPNCNGSRTVAFSYNGTTVDAQSALIDACSAYEYPLISAFLGVYLCNVQASDCQ